MEHTIRNESGVTVLDLRGEIDVSCAPVLRAMMMDLLEHHSGRLLVNLSDVVYIDSAGLSVLIAAYRQTQKTNGMLVLSSPRKPVQQVFEITGVASIFPLYPTVEEGISAMSPE